MSGIGLSYELVVYDRDGNVKERRREPGHSFTHNFYSMIEALLKNGGVYRGAWGATTSPIYTTAVNRGGAAISMSSYDFQSVYASKYTPKPGGFSCDASAGDTDTGIVVGRGETAFEAPITVDGITTTRKYNIGEKISHGTASGQLVYDAMRFPDVQVQGSVLIVQLQRLFTNNSDGAVVIKEIGLFNKCTSSSSSVPDSYILTIYDSLADGLSLGSGEMLGVTYDVIFNT